MSEEWNKIPGGGSVVSALFPLGHYLKLDANNADHFAEWALHIAGHTVAAQQAVLTHNSGDEKQLELAYAMNAFADHYLTDLFSAGHLRVPRKQLAAVVTPSDLGLLITRFMHDEDSKFGLATLPDKEIDDDYQTETGTGLGPIAEGCAVGVVCQGGGDCSGGCG